MVINNTSVFTKDEALDYFYEMAKSGFKKKFIFPSILVVLGVIIVIISYQNKSYSDYISIGFAFVFLALFFIIHNFVNIKTYKSKVLKQNKELENNNLIYEFTFKEESFFVNTKIGNVSNKTKGKYTDLKKIIKSKDKIILKLSSDEAFVAKIEGFKNPKELDVLVYGLSKHKIKVHNLK